jgi:hypothetical protein
MEKWFRLMCVCLEQGASAVYITTTCAILHWGYQCRRQICFFPTRGRVLDVLESSLDDQDKEKVTVRTRKRHAGSGDPGVVDELEPAQ